MSQFSIYLRVTDHPPTIESKVRYARPGSIRGECRLIPKPRRCYASALPLGVFCMHNGVFCIAGWLNDG